VMHKHAWHASCACQPCSLAARASAAATASACYVKASICFWCHASDTCNALVTFHVLECVKWGSVCGNFGVALWQNAQTGFSSMHIHLTCTCACLPTLQLGREGFSSSRGKFQAGTKADVMSAAFLPSQWLVTGSPAGELLLWDARAAQPTFGCCCQVGLCGVWNGGVLNGCYVWQLTPAFRKQCAAVPAPTNQYMPGISDLQTWPDSWRG
jgi:hypothetical protein